MKKVEKDVVLEEVKNELNFIEKIIVNLFPKTCIKIYGIASKRATNNILF